jgi:MSHA biogenesis protein MshK
LVYPLFDKLLGVFLLIFVLAADVCLAAESLPDPTRPPALLGPSPGYGEELEKGPPPLPVLQSVILSAGRKFAIIGGQEVKLGGKFGDAKLVRLTPNEAVLRTAEGVQVLKLFPEAEKKIHTVRQGDEMSGSNKRRPAPEKKAKQ